MGARHTINSRGTAGRTSTASANTSSMLPRHPPRSADSSDTAISPPPHFSMLFPIQIAPYCPAGGGQPCSNDVCLGHVCVRTGSCRLERLAEQPSHCWPPDHHAIAFCLLLWHTSISSTHPRLSVWSGLSRLRLPKIAMSCSYTARPSASSSIQALNPRRSSTASVRSRSNRKPFC